MIEPIVTVQDGETFGSVAWQDRVGKQIIMKLARGDKLTPGEEGFINTQLNKYGKNFKKDYMYFGSFA